MFSLQKNAAITDAFTKHIIPGAVKGAFRVARAVGTGLLPTPKNAPIGKRVFGLATKGATAGGVFLGAKNISESVHKESGPTYTTMLRNNLIAGNVDKSELSAPDIEAINYQGLK